MATGAAATESLSKALMHHTKHLHQKINDHPFMVSLGDGSFALEDYQQYLGFNLNHMGRADRLRQDIRFCNCSGLQPSLSALDYASHLDSISNTGDFLLVAHEWVQYGRTMAGGQILKRHVAKRLKQLVDTGELRAPLQETGVASYEFSAPTPELRKEWHSHLNSLHFSDEQMQRLIEEAQIAFNRTYESLPDRTAPKSTPRASL